MIKIQLTPKSTEKITSVFLVTKIENPVLKGLNLAKSEETVLKRQRLAARNLVHFYHRDPALLLHFLEEKPVPYMRLEAARKAGFALGNELKSHNISSVVLRSDSKDASLLLAYAEGLALTDYKFDKYKKDKSAYHLATIFLDHSGIKKSDVEELQAVVEAVIAVRHLVNEPVSHLTAEGLSKEIEELGKMTGFTTEVLNKSKIRSLKMGGLLGVNQGSLDPPTFNVLEWKPKNAKNKKPYILVGKGVVYDTGGLTLKPTPNSMDSMKSDMAGAAAVTGIMYVAAKLKLPVYIVGLIPATDNRPGGNALAPGDVINMHDGTSVEVLNSDAEGRLILGDALSYAKKYKPQLVLDFATLTGAAARAIGQYGIICMGTASEKIKNELTDSGNETYERLVELPLWEEYGELLKSDIADMKNVSSGVNAGAITAGKFLEHFTDYPWMHFDIAGPAFLSGQDSYRGKNATGVGVRLIVNFLKKQIKK